MKYRGILVLELILGGIVLLLGSLFVISKIKYFPDYSNYDSMITSGSYLNRYISREPLSAGFMWLMSNIGWDAYGYYVLNWIVNTLIVIYISIRFHKKLWFTTAIFLLFNPLTIIAFQVPRHFTALSIFLLAIHLRGIPKWGAVISSILFQNIIGAFVFMMLFLKSFRVLTLIIGSILALACFYYVSTYFYAFHLELDTPRGRGQLTYTAIFLILYIVLMFKKRVDVAFLFITFILMTLMYLLSAHTYRFFEVWLVIAYLSAIYNLRAADSIIIIRGFTFMSFLCSVGIISFGLFGYGP
jgi:hypothetical protein